MTVKIQQRRVRISKGALFPPLLLGPIFVIAFPYLAQSGQIDHPVHTIQLDLFIFFVVTAGQDWLHLARSERHYSIRNLAIVESPPGGLRSNAACKSPPGDDSLVVKCPS